MEGLMWVEKSFKKHFMVGRIVAEGDNGLKFSL